MYVCVCIYIYIYMHLRYSPDTLSLIKHRRPNSAAPANQLPQQASHELQPATHSSQQLARKQRPFSYQPISCHKPATSCSQPPAAASKTAVATNQPEAPAANSINRLPAAVHSQSASLQEQQQHPAETGQLTITANFSLHKKLAARLTP